MKLKLQQVLCLIGLIFLSGFQLSAQGTLRGTVTDGKLGLPGASVLIKGTGMGAATSIDGKFSIIEVKEGSYTLEVSFMGYETQTIPFEIKSGSTYDFGVIEMKEGSVLDEVVIQSAYRPSQARALSLKKMSPVISEVIASDAIGKLPDRNAAEAVQRMQGVSIERDLGEGRYVSVRGTPIQWSSSTLNGDRMPSVSAVNENRSVQMDIFPSELIEYVRLAKAISPDMDGDAIGGSVDFITKPSAQEEVLTLNLAGGYVEQSQSSTYNGSILYGNKINDKLSFITSAVIWDRTIGSDQYRAIYNFNDPDPTKSFAINELQLRDYIADRRTLGFNAGLSYDINPNNKVYFKGLYSQYLDHQSVRESYFTFNQGNAKLQSRHAAYITDLYSLKLGGESKLSDRLKLDWAVTGAKSYFRFNSPENLPDDERGYPIVNFIQQVQYDGLSDDGLKYWAADAPDGVGNDGDVLLPNLNSTTPLSADAMHLYQVILAKSSNTELDKRGQLDLEYNASTRLNLKVGAKYLHKDKEINSSTIVQMPGALLGVPGAPNTFLSDLQTEEFPYDGGFLTELGEPYNNVIIDQITNDQIDNMFTDEFATSSGLVTVLGEDANSNRTSSYTGTEQVFATYIMGEYDLTPKLKVVGGVRNEYNQIVFNGTEVLSDSTGTYANDVTQDNSYNAFLPMLHFKYSINNNTILRAAYTQSYARADFSDLNPGTIVNQLGRTITEGNTELRPTFSQNFDIMFEHYFNDVGSFTAGVFYKKLTDVIYDDQDLVTLNNEIYLRSRPDNLEDASLMGFEVGLSKRFTKLPGFFSHLGAEGNYSFIDSKVDVPVFENGEQVGSVESTLPKQAKHIFNAILFYESDKFMARVAGNFKGRYVNDLRTIAGPEHYTWYDNNFTVDLSLSYAFTKKLRAYVELNNITNAANRYYHGEVDRVEIEGYNGMRGQVGITYSIL